MNTTLPISKVRKDIFEVTDAARDGDYITITEHGAAKAVLMSADEFESWKETLAVLREFPDIATDLAKARRSVQSGVYQNYKVIAPHGVSRSTRTSRGKRSR